MTLHMTVQEPDPTTIGEIESSVKGGEADTLASSRKIRLTVNLPNDLVEQMRDAVYWSPGLTLAWLVARALRTSLAELHASNRGPFPRRAKPLRAGRPRLAGQSMRVDVPGLLHHAAQESVAPHSLLRRREKREPVVSGRNGLEQTSS